jgi:hypothetical protein
MNPYFILGTVIAVVGAYATGHWQGDSAGQAKVHQAWDKERAAQMAQHAKDQELERLSILITASDQLIYHPLY